MCCIFTKLPHFPISRNFIKAYCTLTTASAFPMVAEIRNLNERHIINKQDGHDDSISPT